MDGWLLSSRVAGRKSGKIAGVGVREKSTATVQPCQAQKRTWGATLLWALLPLCPPTRGDTDKFMNLLYLMYMDVWLLPGSGERVAASEVGGGR